MENFSNVKEEIYSSAFDNGVELKDVIVTYGAIIIKTFDESDLLKIKDAWSEAACEMGEEIKISENTISIFFVRSN